jgi:hypothetical protein
MSKFKIGEKVRYIKHYNDAPMDKDYFEIGKIYTISDDLGFDRSVNKAYLFKGIEDREVYESQIEKVWIRNTKLSRKIHSNAKIIDKEWLEL